ncbi:MAG: hypothetical protein LBK13_09210 [Spirochaetales bacterium]|jgi:hypothetical protein|nr:hypothetical protein [Spirochaetales bacterium]
MAPFFVRGRTKKPGFPLQVLGFAYANPVGFPLQSLAQQQRKSSTRRKKFTAKSKTGKVEEAKKVEDKKLFDFFDFAVKISSLS